MEIVQNRAAPVAPARLEHPTEGKASGRTVNMPVLDATGAPHGAPRGVFVMSSLLLPKMLQASQYPSS